MSHDAATSRREQVRRPQPPELPTHAGVEAAEDTGVRSLSSDDQIYETELPDIVAAQTATIRTWSEWLSGAAATSYYLSLLLHIVGYTLGALAFIWLGHHLLDQETELPPLRASLAEMDREGEQPKFEAVAEIDLTPANSVSSMERISNNLRIVKDGLEAARPSDLLPSMASDDSEGDDIAGASQFLFKLPESGLAVTKGSFTVWADPEVPRVNENYKIIVEIRLPDSVKAYRINDLSGRVIGTDGYRQKIPYDSNSKGAVSYTDEDLREVRIESSSQLIKVRDNKVQLVINVLGAARLVKDVIQVRSRRLKENQELELVFGGKQ